MQAIAGYSITEKIHQSPKSIIYRGWNTSENLPVIIKTLSTEYPTLSELIRLRNHYTIGKNIELPGIVKPLSLVQFKRGLALILEDFGGISLKDYFKLHKLDLAEILKIGIQLTSILENLLANRIIHKDIKPHNILINPETLAIKITDFSISSLLPREQAYIINPDRIEGTLAYISPEQTGRMNRGIDYRTDFYSLGVTLYEMLTGQLPFESTDPMELVHFHIAKQPVTPMEIDPAIPEMVSDLVMKLMAKTAEDRYQSAKGIKEDLETCLIQLETKGKIEPFILAKRDIAEKFQIPEKLYGREKEIETLMAAFDRVACTHSDRDRVNSSHLGGAEMMLVAGYSGIGKSALVYEIHKPIVRQRGYFISGKFDQFKRNIPFASLVQAFRHLIQQLLTESESRIAGWQEKLLQALGTNGQVIIDVIPEVERIIGTQPPLQEIGPTESQNRFNLVFQNFIHVFTKAEHPLVLFLDDLQWADLASLKLIQLLMTNPDTKHLFLIGAYRDNEVNALHPTILTLDEIKKAGVTVNYIILEPLNQSELNQLVADALNCPALRAKPLSELVFEKTQGNPFFSTQFLNSLYAESLLEYEVSKGYWQCDIAKLKALAVSNNVVDFMALQLQKLPSYTQEVLKLAACIGHQFDLETLSIVYQKSPGETAADLWKALQSGLVLPISEVYKFFQEDRDEPAIINNGKITNYQLSYKFLHDRVQQAAYTLIPADEKKVTHLKIGRLLLKNAKESELEEKVFDIVNQLNIGCDSIADELEKNQLAKLNLIAGRKAKLSTAYQPAIGYLNVGLKILADASWKYHYQLTFDLHVEAVEVEYLNTNFDRAKELSDLIIQKTNNLLDKVKIYELQIQYYTSQNQASAAIETGLEVLKMLGIFLPITQKEQITYTAKFRKKLAWGDRQIKDLATLPIMTDPHQLAAMRILVNVASAAFHTNPSLLQVIVFAMVEICIKYGNSPLASFAYSYYAVLSCGIYKDIDTGYQFGQIAIAILEKFNARELKAKIVDQFNVFVRHWKAHAREALEPFQEAIQTGIESGDIEYAFYAAIDYCNQLFFVGEVLEAVERKQSQYLEIMEKFHLKFHIYYCLIGRQVVLNLLGKSAEPSRLIGEQFDETKMLPIWMEENNIFFVFCTYCCKINLLYLFKEYPQALEIARLAEKYEKAGGGMLYVAEYNFYYSLILLANYANAESPEARANILEKVRLNQKKMKNWASHAPVNFQHKYDLVEAEKSRVLGKNWVAQELYDRAISGAKNHSYIQEEALANELAAEFYLANGREKIAQLYMTDAYYDYIHWGAVAKAQHLEQTYPQLLTRIIHREASESLASKEIGSAAACKTHSATSTSESTVLDLATVMKVSVALSEEIVLEKLLASLMKVILENAGAEKGFLIMKKSGKLSIEAAGAINSSEITVLQSIPLESEEDRLPLLAAAVVNYVDRTQSTLMLNNAAKEPIFAADPYIATVKPKSILCLPIVHKGKHQGILYLENNLSTGVFSKNRVQVLKLLTSQAAVSIENALLYQNLQTANQALQASETQLKQKTIQIEESLRSLQEAQLQLIQSEKMSSLGQLVAGVAHEINNPVNFIAGNLLHAEGYVKDLVNLLNHYMKKYPAPGKDIENQIEEIDLEYLMEDLPKLISSMQAGTDRIQSISTSLRTFSRSDTTSKVPFNIHEGIDSTLLILKHRLKSNENRPAIEVRKEYGLLMPVNCYPGQLNQVFCNILGNAIDALEEFNLRRSKEEIKRSPNIIWIKTELNLDNNSIVIRIKDNGIGMPENVRKQVFDHLYTTKPVGCGTGLGLSISRQIIEEKHQGKLTCISTPGEGSEFTIELPLE